MPLSYSEVTKIATFEASKTHRQLGYKFNEAKSVDVFGAIETSNIALMFQPLGNLAGAYIPPLDEHTPAGILINRNLPITKQRYSAAHEFCHYLRNDPTSVDTEDELFSIDSYKRDPNERIAESFAAAFLMPLPLLIRMVHELGVHKSQLEPAHIYSLSLRLGCSYIATVNQLRATNLISAQQYKRFQAIKPKTIKEKLGIEGLESSWNDVWVLSSSDRSQTIEPKTGDTLKLYLEENPTTGFIWESEMVIRELTEGADEETTPISLYETNTRADNKDRIVGVGGIRKFTFKVNLSGRIELNFYRRQPWKPDNSVERLKLNLNVQDKRQGINLSQLTG